MFVYIFSPLKLVGYIQFKSELFNQNLQVTFVWNFCGKMEYMKS